ncbi:cell wall-binding repeat-containing protein [Herbiconiux sp. P18]|uniref:cell wall-binding repeat-containing protein n=1 Tax=Herbiconiux liangxiaofengii TaxID=3342795 RepID=UPI0035B816BD
MNLLSRGLIAGALVVATVAGSALAAAADDPAELAAGRGVSFQVVDEIEPGSDHLDELEIDSVTRRAFVLDQRARAVRVYDISDGTLKPAGVVPFGTAASSPRGLAVNDVEHEVYVIDDSAGFDEVVGIDGDPASEGANTVMWREPTRGKRAFAIAVDTSTHSVAVANGTSKDVSVIDLDDGAHRTIPIGLWLQDITVDPITHTVYVASSVDSAIVAIKGDGSWTTTPLRNNPSAVEVVNGQLIVAIDRPSSNHLESYDLPSMTKTGESPALEGYVSDITADVSRHAIYVSRSTDGLPRIEVLRTGDLSRQGAQPVGNYYGNLRVDPASHRLIGISNAISSSVVMLEARQSPLPAVDRLGGADRFAVAAAVSRDSFSSGAAPVAYVASGAVYADALSGAAAAGLEGGPVLLATRDTLPEATVTELRRLQPSSIVILGGPASIGDGVEKALAEFGPVTRLSGADRYAVSAAVAARAFPEGSDIAYLASGEVFPDALSAAPSAGREKGPVLLTGKDALPGSVAAELARLTPNYVYVLGGPATVSPAVVTELEKTTTVIRITGADRFAVSAAASARAFRAGTDTVYIASGETFADALAGGPPAIIGGSPVLLVGRDSIPEAIDTELKRLSPYRIVLLGGENTVSKAVAEKLTEYLPD